MAATASGGGIHCLECGHQVEIIEGNKKLSIDLHKLSHMNLGTASQGFDQSLPVSLGKNNSDSRPDVCSVCNEEVEILYDNVALSHQLHSRKHKVGTEMCSEDQLSNCSSGKSNHSSVHTQHESDDAEHATMLDDGFDTMYPGIKTHLGFVDTIADGMTFCNICKVNIDTLNVSEHLKTKLHEYNTIMTLKTFLPKELHPSLDFLSFYESHLSCDLCRVKIDLCSNNLHKTITNILIHNAQSCHLSKMGPRDNSDSNDHCNASQALVQSLSEISIVISENKSYLEVEMQPKFKCNLCNKCIAYNEDDSALLDNLNSHFISSGHAKHHKAKTVLKLFENSNISGKENHIFEMSKGNIYCKLCFCNVEVDIQMLEEHVKTSSASGNYKNLPFSKQVEEVLRKEPNLARTSTSDHDMTNDSLDIRGLLKAMPPEFHDVNYIVDDCSGKAIKCLVCECTIPRVHLNLKTHLMGKQHQNNEESLVGNNAVGQPKSSSNMENSQSTETADLIFNYLANSDPLVKSNRKTLMKYKGGKYYLCKACDDLIPVSINTDIFKTNIYKHVQSMKHQRLFPYQKQESGAKVFSKETKGSEIDEIFRALPQSLKHNKQFIKPHRNETNALFCCLCKLKVPAHFRCLREHLEGGYHTDQYTEPGFLSQALGYAMNIFNDAVFYSIISNDKVIKDNEKHITKKGDDYFCNLCQTIIKLSVDQEQLRRKFLNHFEGKGHLKNVVYTLMVTVPVLRSEQTHVTIRNKNIYCTLCAISLPPGIEEATLRKHVFAHFSGNKHKNNKNPSQSAPSFQSQPFQTTMSNHTTMPNPFATFNPPTIADLPTVPDQSPTVLDAGNPLSKAFQNIPADLQIDMKYVKTASIEGYLFCMLCNNTINPYYLKEHLLEKNHIKEKTVFEERISLWKRAV